MKIKFKEGAAPQRYIGYRTTPLGGTISQTFSSFSYPMFERIYETSATHLSKLKINHYYDDPKQEYKDVNNSLSYLLMQKPNPRQTPTEFWNVFFYNLAKYKTAIAIPDYEIEKIEDKRYKTIQYEYKYKEINVLDMSNTSIAIANSDKSEYLLISINASEYKLIPYEDIIIQRDKPHSVQNNENIEIEENQIPKIVSKSLSVLLSELESNFEINGIVTLGESENYYDASMLDEDVKKQKVNDILKRVKNKLIVLDGTEKFEPVETKFRKNTISDIKELQTMFYEYYGIPKSIMDVTYNQEQFTPFFTSYIVPKIENLEYELNNKLLTKQQREEKQKISISYTLINNFTAKDLISWSKDAIYQGYANRNKVLGLMGEKPIVGGDEYTTNKNMDYLNTNKEE